MLPEGWKKTSLEDIAEVRSGIAKGQKSVTNPINLPYLRVANVQDGYLDLTEVKTIEIDKEKVERFSLHTGDVLMNEGGDFDKLGRGDVWRGQITPCLHQNHVFAVRPDQEKLDSYFLANLSASPYGKGYFLSCAKRSTNLASINSTQLKQFPVVLPPLPEQKKIAAILSTWDRAIEGTEKLLANSQQQKKALMQQLLTGKKRLPGFTGEWKKHRLSDFFVRLMQRNTSGNTNVVTISAQDGLVKQEEYFKKTVASETLDGYFLLENGDFAYNKSYSIGYPMGAIKRLNRYEKGVVTTLYICFRLKSLQFANGDFFEFYFDSGLINYGLTQIAHEGGRAHGLLNVKPADFMHLQVTVPSVDEQEAIAAVLTRANEEITAIESDLLRLRQEKKALMQQLLTGKRRVTVD